MIVSPGAEVDLARVTDLRQQADALRARLATLRGLDYSREVPVVVRTAEELRSYLIERFDELGEAAIDASERSLQILGVLQSDDDYRAMVLSLLTEQVAGYYEPREGSFYLLDTDVANFDPAVIVHELQHAGQDVAWDLDAYLRPAWRVSDTLGARSALAEGDATLTMLDFSLDGQLAQLPSSLITTLQRELRGALNELSERYPRYVVESLVAPYFYGTAFAWALFHEGGWEAVNAAFLSPPVSSEQVLYPERYLALDAPSFLAFDVPERLGARRETDIFGMLGMRALFAQILAGKVSEAAVEQATSQWDGDRFELWQGDGGDTLVWLSVFDEVAGAEDFYELLESALRVWVPAGMPSCAGGLHGGRCGAVFGERGVLVERWGDMALLVIDTRDTGDASEAQLLEVAESVWASRRRSRYPAEFER